MPCVHSEGTWIQVSSEFRKGKVDVVDHNDVATGTYYEMLDSYENYLAASSIREMANFLLDRTNKTEAVVLINDLVNLVRGGSVSLV